MNIIKPTLIIIIFAFVVGCTNSSIGNRNIIKNATDYCFNSCESELDEFIDTHPEEAGMVGELSNNCYSRCENTPNDLNLLCKKPLDDIQEYARGRITAKEEIIKEIIVDANLGFPECQIGLMNVYCIDDNILFRCDYKEDGSGWFGCSSVVRLSGGGCFRPNKQCVGRKMNNAEVVAQEEEMERELLKDMKDKYPNAKNPLEGYKYVAVGYLDITEPQYEVGEVPPGFVKKLKALFHSGTMIGSLGSHQCEFCLNQGVKKLPRDALSSCEKTLTDKENKIIYKFPEMIFHYIEVHQFKPSQAFIDFVMKTDESE